MRSVWLHESLDGVRLLPPLSGSVAADVAVVGAGLTGLWCALHLKELASTAEVIVLEADVCGGGASGRNGGFVLDWWPKLGSFERVCGVDGARRLMAAAEASIDATAAFCEEHAPEAAFRRVGWLWGATNPTHLGSWVSILELHRARGCEVFREVGPEEAQALGGSPRLLGGVYQRNTGMVQPARLVQGLKRVALERGVTIHENSPVRRLVPSTPTRLHTPAGVVSAGRVILAMNCWLISIKRVRQSMLVLGTDMACTEPIPDQVSGPFAAGVGMTDSRVMLRFARATANGRLTVGRAGAAVIPGARGQHAFSGVVSPARARALQKVYVDLFPTQAAAAPLTRSWTGPVDRSWEGLPFFESAGPRGAIIWSGGYSGNGVGPAYIVSRMLASMALDVDDEYLDMATMLPPRGGLPPEPARFIGGHLVRRAIARKEACEERDAKVGPITRRVAALKPADAVHPSGE
jgi:glycine/D-amino acid oxidase-like deaminating enzyme